MILSILPEVEKIGTVYNPGEANSIAANAERLVADEAAKPKMFRTPVRPGATHAAVGTSCRQNQRGSLVHCKNFYGNA